VRACIVRPRSPGEAAGLRTVSISRRKLHERAPPSQTALIWPAGPLPAHPNQFGRLAALGEGLTQEEPGSGLVVSAQPKPPRGPAEEHDLHHPVRAQLQRHPAIERLIDPETTPVALKIRGSARL